MSRRTYPITGRPWSRIRRARNPRVGLVVEGRDAAQLRLIRLLAAPEDNLFVVGDDDQTIYAWRLADVT